MAEPSSRAGDPPMDSGYDPALQDAQLAKQNDPILMLLAKMNGELDRRRHRVRLLDPYYEGACPLPLAVRRAGVTKAYSLLMPVSDAPWGSLVVDSVQDRLELAGLVDTENQSKADKIWDVLQRQHIESESKLVHNSALVNGRAYATVWPTKGDGDNPTITFDGADMMCVKYAEGSRFNRQAALRRWMDEDTRRPFATLYTPDYVYKFKGPRNSSAMAGTRWEPRRVPGEEWPLPNVLGEVNVVELGVNRRLKPGVWGFARGEYEHCVGLIDRINLLTFLGLVVAFWMGFPIRGIIGDKITREVLKDDDGNPLLDPSGEPMTKTIPPFQPTADGIVQLENPEAKLLQFDAADRSNLSIFAELSQLAMVTKTPRHYFPYQGGLSNISADAIRADEGALNAKVIDHKAGLGDSWLEVARLVGKARDSELELGPKAKAQWKNHESRSLAEMADAASKLEGVLPWQIAAELALNATEADIKRWSELRKEDAFAQLAEAALMSNRVGKAVVAAAEGTPLDPTEVAAAAAAATPAPSNGNQPK